MMRLVRAWRFSACGLSFSAVSYSACNSDSVAACAGASRRSNDGLSPADNMKLGGLALLGALVLYYAGDKEMKRASYLRNIVDLGKHGAVGSWRVHVDPASGRTYYYNPETQKTTWHKPPTAAEAVAARFGAALAGAECVPLIGDGIGDKWTGRRQYAVIDTHETKWVLSTVAKAKSVPAPSSSRSMYEWEVERAQREGYEGHLCRRQYTDGLGVRIAGLPYKLKQSDDSLMLGALQRGSAGMNDSNFLIGSENVLGAKGEQPRTTALMSC